MLELHPKGTWSRIREFLDTVPSGASVYWVTYSLRPTDRLLSILDGLVSKGCHVRFVCKHPQEDAGLAADRPLYRADHERLVAVLKRDERSGLKGLRGDSCYPDGESGTYGNLHAKLLVCDGSNGVRALVGSANCSRWSLEELAETLIELRGCENAARANAIARQLWDASHAISPDVCPESDGSGAAQTPPEDLGMILGAPVDTGSDRSWQRKPLAVDDPARYRPGELSQLAARLDGMLRNWPSTGRDSQYRIFGSLRRSAVPRDILYLPVGVGKTYIAYRWLLWRVSQAHREGCGDKRGLFVVPNEWIERTVRRDLADAQLFDERFVRVVRVAAVGEDDLAGAAAIALDECHNWSPHQDPADSGYAFVWDVTKRRSIPLLGLSATPCRMDHGRFDILEFARRFRDEDLAEFKPLMLLSEAIDEGFIVAPRFVPFEVSPESRDEIMNVLGDGTVEWGDYSAAVLREVWALLNKDPRDLARKVARRIRTERAKRILVFLPPVSDSSDRFIAALREEVGEQNFFNFLSRHGTEAEARVAFGQFQRAATGSPAVLVTVDRFAEGISVPDVDMIVMLRATLSPRVFIQALGRGLRRAGGKTECVILDPVGLKERFDMFEETLAGARHDPSAEDEPGGEFDGWSFNRVFSCASVKEMGKILAAFDRPSAGLRNVVYQRLKRLWDGSEAHVVELLAQLDSSELRVIADAMLLEQLPRSKSALIQAMLDHARS